MGSGKGKTRRARASFPNDVASMQDRCLNFPSSLEAISEETILRKVVPQMESDYYVGIFFDTKTNFPVIVTAEGPLDAGLQCVINPERSDVLVANSLAGRANSIVFNKELEGYRVISTATPNARPAFDAALLEKELERIEVVQQPLRGFEGTLEKVTF